MWSRPSLPGSRFRARRVEDLRDRPFVDLAHLISAVISSMRFLARRLVGVVEAIVIVLSSPMSIVQPVSSVSARIVEPPLPMTTRIFRVDLHRVGRGELRDLGLAPRIASCILRCRRALACASATCMISLVMPRS
jgi:hypothetical protein